MLNKIDGQTLQMLTDKDLKNELKVKNMTQRKRIFAKIDKIKQQQNTSELELENRKRIMDHLRTVRS